MNEMRMLFVVLIPFITGILISVMKFRSRKNMLLFTEVMAILNSILVFLLLLYRPEGALTVFRFTGNLSIRLQLDGMGALFAGMSAILWPFALLYAFEYMKGEKGEKTFFMFYVITYGVTLGIALSENILTMYFFFEMLSLITLPLVMFTRTREAILASRTYLYYMLGGAAFAFVGVIFILTYGCTSSFIPGGVMNLVKIGDKTNMMYLIYIISFCGFAVKTAMWPFSAWLPKAGVAPTPVTALLHAVAVVNTGAFAVMRITYFSFGIRLLRGTWAQYTVMGLVIVTIVYGCSRALNETHIKRRLAWSTVSNLSYILFGVVLMTPLGLVGAMAHMLFHSFMKICSFFCAGAVMHKTGKSYIHELDGMGRKMPRVFVIFTVSALALMGVPGLCGFVSKWYLAKAAMESEDTVAWIGVAALLISALLTAIYMLTIVVRAFFPGKDFDYDRLPDVKDPGWRMLVPLVFFVVMMIVFGLCSGQVMELLQEIAAMSVS